MPASKAPNAALGLLSRYWAFFRKFPWFGDSEEEVQKTFGCSNRQLILLHLIAILLALLLTAVFAFEPIRTLPLPSWLQAILFILATLLLRPVFMMVLQAVMPQESDGDEDDF